jgi:hypothetical protein
MALAVFRLVKLTNATTGAEDGSANYLFTDLQGVIAASNEQLEVIERFGIDSHGIRKTGKRGRPFQMLSIEYFAGDASTVFAQINLYRALIGAAHGVKLVQNDLALWAYDVLDAQFAQPVRKIGRLANALTPTADIEMRTLWTLKGR